MTGCFVCPIYDKGTDFEFGYEFVGSAVKYDLIDSVYFILSTQDQQKKFCTECEKRFGAVPHTLLYEVDLSNCKNPVSIKKFYALQKLAGEYDYIAAVDCECVFLKNFSVGDTFDEIWKTGNCFATNYSRKCGDITLTAAITLGIEKNEKIIKETKGYSVTWWFNDIPVYRTSDLAQFFDWIESNHYYDKIYNEWCCFDHIVYGLWLIMEKDLQLKHYPFKGIIGIVEMLCRPEVGKKLEIEKTMGTHWSSRINVTTPPNENLCMQFHRDHRKTSIYYCLRRIASFCYYGIRHPRNRQKKLWQS